MNFDEAIQAHSAWKMKLASYLRRPDGSLDPAIIRPDNRCALGQWLHGEGAKHAGSAEYKTLVAEHARFHRAAASVVDMAHAGKDTSAETALGSSSEFGTASKNVVAAIMSLKRKVGA